ncbi:arylsulfatase [Acinetobacter zhairhuonensis]|uniref:arylsulfatase n=1 Tax=Acinetobacter sp. A7.4 TaxID=2919921 RepID=UPI001F500A5C|nr:arylsulfatase [Acinetobacter sp. A7.4]MCJ8162641.1 arylsulfatase [Acinetobacter sp. A7.4]
MQKNIISRSLALMGGALLTAAAFAKPPNILIIFPDDVGWSNVSAYGQGVMGYTTPNIDRIANEGIKFTEHYAQPSSTAGRAALITGQYPIRSGMTTVGRPGSPLGLKAASPTLAEVLKPLGYMNGQFGKNHLGDRNENLPTVHGFDEFFGNLYHLNTEEEPEQYDYPKDPEFKKKFGTRGVLHCYASSKSDSTDDPRFGKMGKQTCTDTGALTTKRMETVDDEFIAASLDFMKKSKDADKPFFVWLNPSRMHMYTHLRDAHRYLAADKTTGADMYGSGVLEHDMQIGKLLDDMKAMGVLDDTIVIYSTDNGPEHSARLHGGTTPFRGEKMTTYEGGVRVPMMVRWPGHIPAGQTRSGIQAHMDIFTTLAAAAGNPNVVEEMKTKRKQYIDGVNNLDYWTGKSPESKRNNFLYYHESTLRAIRLNQWKLHFETSENYYDQYQKQKFPVFYNIHLDPYESFDNKTDRSDIIQSKQWLNEPVQEILNEHIQSLQKYPPVQKAATLDFSEVIKQMQNGNE